MDKTFGDLEPGDSVYVKENSGPFREAIFKEFVSIMDTELIHVIKPNLKSTSYYLVNMGRIIETDNNEVILTTEKDVADFYDYFWRLRD